MSHLPIDFALSDLTEVMRLVTEEPSTHRRLLDLARIGITARYSNIIDKTLMDEVTRPTSMDIVIHAQMDMTKLLVTIGRKFLEDYNHRLKERNQSKVA